MSLKQGPYYLELVLRPLFFGNFHMRYLVILSMRYMDHAPFSGSFRPTRMLATASNYCSLSGRQPRKDPRFILNGGIGRYRDLYFRHSRTNLYHALGLPFEAVLWEMRSGLGPCKSQELFMKRLRPPTADGSLFTSYTPPSYKQTPPGVGAQRSIHPFASPSCPLWLQPSTWLPSGLHVCLLPSRSR